jgi:hypothetical protein
MNEHRTEEHARRRSGSAASPRQAGSDQPLGDGECACSRRATGDGDDAIGVDRSAPIKERWQAQHRQQRGSTRGLLRQRRNAIGRWDHPESQALRYPLLPARHGARCLQHRKRTTAVCVRGRAGAVNTPEGATEPPNKRMKLAQQLAPGGG